MTFTANGTICHMELKLRLLKQVVNLLSSAKEQLRVSFLWDF